MFSSRETVGSAADRYEYTDRDVHRGEGGDETIRIVGPADADRTALDAVALNEAATAAFPSLLGYARLLTGDRARADEVVHEALVRCLRRGRRAPIHEFLPYARRAVLHEVFRDARRRGREPVLHDDTLRPAPAAGTERDTAELLGCSVPAVKSLCHRGIALLREQTAMPSQTGHRPRRVAPAAREKR